MTGNLPLAQDDIERLNVGLAEALDDDYGSLARLDEFLGEHHDLLSSREKMVLLRRFCLDETTKAGTLEQVGKELGLSKERVRQVQTSALDKLRKALSGPRIILA